MTLELIEKNGETFVLVPIHEYEELLEDSEMLDDIQLFDKAKWQINHGKDEVIPFSVTKRRIAGENPVKIWREYRHLTQESLASLSGVSRGMIGAIESGYKKGSIATLRKLAQALDVDLDNIAG